VEKIKRILDLVGKDPERIIVDYEKNWARALSGEISFDIFEDMYKEGSVGATQLEKAKAYQEMVSRIKNSIDLAEVESFIEYLKKNGGSSEVIAEFEAILAKKAPLVEKLNQVKASLANLENQRALGTRITSGGKYVSLRVGIAGGIVVLASGVGQVRKMYAKAEGVESFETIKKSPLEAALGYVYSNKTLMKKKLSDPCARLNVERLSAALTKDFSRDEGRRFAELLKQTKYLRKAGASKAGKTKN
jgi:hypothetical protein